MPELQPIIVFGIILVAIPLQFFLSPSTTNEIKYNLQKLTDKFLDIVKSYGYNMPGVEDRQETFRHHRISIEDRRSSKEYYASSSKVRERTPEVKFRIGDVVRNKALNYRALVIGWDLRAQAPPDFFEALRDTPDWKDGPHYVVLVDGQDRLYPEMGYAPQTNLVPSEGRVYHHLVTRYVERYDEVAKRYVVRPRLKETYPDD